MQHYGKNKHCRALHRASTIPPPYRKRRRDEPEDTTFDDVDHGGEALLEEKDNSPFIYHPAQDQDDSTDISPKVYYPPGTYYMPPEAKSTYFTYTNQQKGYVQLLQFLDKHNAPKYAFDKLLDSPFNVC
jgi:hypothetical protein